MKFVFNQEIPCAQMNSFHSYITCKHVSISVEYRSPISLDHCFIEEMKLEVDNHNNVIETRFTSI